MGGCFWEFPTTFYPPILRAIGIEGKLFQNFVFCLKNVCFFHYILSFSKLGKKWAPNFRGSHLILTKINFSKNLGNLFKWVLNQKNIKTPPQFFRYLHGRVFGSTGGNLSHRSLRWFCDLRVWVFNRRPNPEEKAIWFCFPGPIGGKNTFCLFSVSFMLKEQAQQRNAYRGKKFLVW